MIYHRERKWHTPVKKSFERAGLLWTALPLTSLFWGNFRMTLCSRMSPSVSFDAGSPVFCFCRSQFQDLSMGWNNQSWISDLDLLTNNYACNIRGTDFISFYSTTVVFGICSNNPFIRSHFNLTFQFWHHKQKIHNISYANKPDK